MAKSSVPGLDRIRELFTSAERAVLESTAGRALVESSRKQLDASLAQARALRDKWRDLHATQARTTKRKGATAAANARSREKSDMFTAAIDRLQARLAEFGLAPAAGRPATKGVTKAARRAAHRATRAGVKGKLAHTAADLTRRRAAQAVPRVTAAPTAAATPPVAAPARAKTAKKAKKTKGSKRRSAKPITLAAGGGQALRFDVAKQRSAKASATAARLTLDGKVTRRGGHVLAATKRRQAARDRRGR